MKKIYLTMVAFAITFSVINYVNAQNQVYWREGFPRAGGSTFPTTTPGTINPPGYYKSGTGLGWYSYGVYNANSSQNCSLNGNTPDHLRLLGAAVDSAFLVTPTVDAGINEFHFLRTRTGKRFTLYKTIDTVASTTNWVKVAFIAASTYDICTDTTILVNDPTAKRLKLVIRQTEDTDIDSIWLTSSTIILPVTFKGVNAVQANGSAKISWNIATEVNTLRYDVEKSLDGRHFTTVGSVIATSAGKYSWMDNTVSTGDNYYRIKGVDKDGSAITSSIVRINSSRSLPELTVMPNPVKGGLLQLQLSNFEKGTYNVQLSNNSGQQLFSAKINNEAGSSSQTLQLPSHIQPGIYMLQLVNGATRITKPVVVE